MLDFLGDDLEDCAAGDFVGVGFLGVVRTALGDGVAFLGVGVFCLGVVAFWGVAVFLGVTGFEDVFSAAF